MCMFPAPINLPVNFIFNCLNSWRNFHRSVTCEQEWVCIDTCFLCKLVGFFLCFCNSWTESALYGLYYVLHWAAAEICFCSHAGPCFILWVALVCSYACLFAFSTWSLVLSSQFLFPLGCLFTMQLSFVSHHCKFLLSAFLVGSFYSFATLPFWFIDFCVYI